MRDNIEVSGPQKVTVANAIGRWGGRGRQGPPGPPGERGPRGFPGPPGESGGFAHYGTEPPADPEAGQFWFDTSTEPPILNFWTGDDWQALEAEAAIPDPLTLAQFIATASFRLNSASGPTVTSGAAAPSTAQPTGSLYLRTGAPTIAGQRLYWNSNGSAGGWVAIDDQPSTIPDPLYLTELFATRIGSRMWAVGTPSDSPNNPQIQTGASAPNSVAPPGSLYIRTDTPTVAGQRLYWNQDGLAGGWIAIDYRPPPITVGTTAPSSPQVGDIWVDTS